MISQHLLLRQIRNNNKKRSIANMLKNRIAPLAESKRDVLQQNIVLTYQQQPSKYKYIATT